MQTLPKKSILALLFILSFAACKKKQDKPDRTVRKVTYTFTPNGASSLIVYRSIKNGNEISRSPISDVYIAYDEVVIGDKTTLKMSTTANIPSTYRVTIDYIGVTIGLSSTVVSDAEGKHVILEKTFTKEDF
jgi:hypothetical protein